MSYIQRVRKALAQMNLQTHNVVTDIVINLSGRGDKDAEIIIERMRQV